MFEMYLADPEFCTIMKMKISNQTSKNCKQTKPKQEIKTEKKNCEILSNGQSKKAKHCIRMNITCRNYSSDSGFRSGIVMQKLNAR